MSAENWRTAWCGKLTHGVLEAWAAESSPLNSERGRHGLCPHRSFDLAEELGKQRAKPLVTVSYHFSPYLPPASHSGLSLVVYKCQACFALAETSVWNALPTDFLMPRPSGFIRVSAPRTSSHRSIPQLAYLKYHSCYSPGPDTALFFPTELLSLPMMLHIYFFTYLGSGFANWNANSLEQGAQRLCSLVYFRCLKQCLGHAE